MNINKKAQEEMIGFGVIIALVAIVLLVLLFFSINTNDEGFDSVRVGSFVQSVMDYTTSCQKYQGTYLDIGDLIYSCAKNETCVNNGNNSCKVLNESLNEILNNTWNVGKEYPTKAYNFIIVAKNESEYWEPVYSNEKGSKENITMIKNANQSLPAKAGVGKVRIMFRVYE